MVFQNFPNLYQSLFWKILKWTRAKSSLVHPELWGCHFGRFPDLAIFPNNQKLPCKHQIPTGAGYASKVTLSNWGLNPFTIQNGIRFWPLWPGTLTLDIKWMMILKFVWKIYKSRFSRSYKKKWLIYSPWTTRTRTTRTTILMQGVLCCNLTCKSMGQGKYSVTTVCPWTTQLTSLILCDVISELAGLVCYQQLWRDLWTRL